MYIDGHLKGGFQTVEAYAGFCGYFKNWLDTKSIKLSVPRQGELVAEDYRACLEYVNSEVTDVLSVGILCGHLTFSSKFLMCIFQSMHSMHMCFDKVGAH